MPILAPEPSLFPSDLLDDVALPSGDVALPSGDVASPCGGAAAPCGERQWWAVYTKSRQEKSLARKLLAQEVPFYLPLVPKASVIAGRKVQSQLPLFGSYLFLNATHDERVQALATKHVAHMFAPPDQSTMMRDLRHVRQLIASGVPLTVEGRLAAGQRVRVKQGSLMGLEGVILARRGEDRLLVNVDFLQQGVSILIGDFQVEPV
jgi:transcription antitermination factor NusG